jgi:hypothetical protein
MKGSDLPSICVVSSRAGLHSNTAAIYGGYSIALLVDTHHLDPHIVGMGVKTRAFMQGA